MDEDYQGDYDLKKAARAIFLTLNKTARKVTDLRNRLLDDNDLIALFMRDTLSAIKKKDMHSLRSLRAHNIELDQPQDRTKIADPIAVSGVNHVYYMVEHLILNNPSDVNGVKPRAGKFWKRTDLGLNASPRLHMLDVLGSEAAGATSRDFFTVEIGTKLTEQFRQQYGNSIIQMFEEFEPYEAHNKAALWLEKKLISESQTRILPILFEGQGIGRVFEQHLKNLRERNKPQKAELTQIIARLDATAHSIRVAIDEFKKTRAINFLERINDKNKIRDESGEYVNNVTEFVNKILYEGIFRTVAFQSALVCGFFGEVERANEVRAQDHLPPLDVAAIFSEFLSQMNAFFMPTSHVGLRRLVECFHKKVEGEIKDWKLADSPTTFRHVVYRGEMQPDEWPKYKYLMLELWRPSDPALKKVVDAERGKCQIQIYNSLLDEVRKETLQKLSKRQESLTQDEQKQIDTDVYGAFKGFLQTIGLTLADIPSHKTMNEKTEKDRGDAEPIVPTEEQVWEESESS